ncbi:MAG: hypothetical protein GX318_05700 [Clostridia bacterium]|nr:hypothetical protein [Clostridia bacterium]
MFSELIYTRCGQGIDILKSGEPIYGDGFKVYSCTPSIIEGGKTDLPFLLDTVKAKQSYMPPDFMDDAYIYLAPDMGDPIMVNFHPIINDAASSVDCQGRGDNFINQVFIGDFSDFYPFELFDDSTIWDAKFRGQAFYCEETPKDLPARGDVGDPVGQIAINDIREFIFDGRRDALMKAVSFLITQYGLPPDKRKYLVIRDDSSKNIELWISAIEYAFSPRMAASISFATRLDNFPKANIYRVDKEGFYIQHKGFFGRKGERRFRAMIVGVDRRDRKNTKMARTEAKSSFVVLDGVEKKAVFDAAVEHPYYRLITSFNETHQRFCRDFLQMLDISKPAPDVYNLHDVFMALARAPLPTNVHTTLNMLATLEKYQLFACPTLRKMCNTIVDGLPSFLRQDFSSALGIVKWLKKAVQLLEDPAVSEKLSKTLRNVFVDLIFRRRDAGETLEFWENVKNSEFVSLMASFIRNPETLEEYSMYMERLEGPEAAAFVQVYIDSAVYEGDYSRQDLKMIVDYGLSRCHNGKDLASARKIINATARIKGVQVGEMLFSIAKDAKKEYGKFIIELIIDVDETIVAEEESMRAFLEKLREEKMEFLFVSVLKCRIGYMTKTREIESFIDQLKKIRPLNTQDLREIFEAVDKNLVMEERSSRDIAWIIQEQKPESARCPISAHLYALEVLKDREGRKKEFVNIYNTLILQGFPSIIKGDYIQNLTQMLLELRLEHKELEYIIQLFSHIPEYTTELVRGILSRTSPEHNDEWNILIAFAAKRQSRDVDKAIIQECANLKKGKKDLLRLAEMLGTRMTRDYFNCIADKARDMIHAGNPQKGAGGLFGKILSKF